MGNDVTIKKHTVYCLITKGIYIKEEFNSMKELNVYLDNVYRSNFDVGRLDIKLGSPFLICSNLSPALIKMNKAIKELKDSMRNAFFGIRKRE